MKFNAKKGWRFSCDAFPPKLPIDDGASGVGEPAPYILTAAAGVPKARVGPGLGVVTFPDAISVWLCAGTC